MKIVLLLLALLSPAFAQASIVCDGTHFLETGSAPSGYAASGVSLSLWVKKASDGVLQGLAGQTSAESLVAEILASNVIRGRDPAGNTFVDSTSTVTGSAWHHLVFTYNSSTGAWVIYLDDDGSPKSGTSGTVTLTAGFFDICRGNTALSDTAPNGTKIALVAFWNSILSAANVTSLKATCSPESVATASNQASWHLTNGSLTDSSANTVNQVNANSLAGSTDEPTPCVATDQTFGFYHRRAS